MWGLDVRGCYLSAVGWRRYSGISTPPHRDRGQPAHEHEANYYAQHQSQPATAGNA